MSLRAILFIFINLQIFGADPFYSLSDTPIFNRVIDARMFRFGEWVFDTNNGVSQTPATLSKALADLSPTFVHGLLYKAPGVNFTSEEVASYIVVRKTILNSSPYCKFSLLLDGSSFMKTNIRSLSALIKNYQYLNGMYPDFLIDAIHFENWTAAYQAQPLIGDYAIQYLHSVNFLVGGNIYDSFLVPDHTDYVGISTNNFRIPYHQDAYPGIGLINNLDPYDFKSEACAFLNYSGFQSGRFQALNDQSRINALEYLDNQQGSGKYTMAWPVFAPLCPSLNAFDATKSAVFSWVKLNGLKGSVNKQAYSIEKLNYESNVIPFRRNISSPNSPNRGMKDTIHPISILMIIIVAI